jgi:hypothetical protein
MEESSSWEADRFTSSQEIPRILLNPKIHYCSKYLLTYLFHGTESFLSS